MQAPRLERGSNRREPTPLTSALLRGSVCPPPPSGECATTPGPFKRATTRQKRTPTHTRYGFLKDLATADYVGQAANYCGPTGLATNYNGGLAGLSETAFAGRTANCSDEAHGRMDRQVVQQCELCNNEPAINHGGGGPRISRRKAWMMRRVGGTHRKRPGMVGWVAGEFPGMAPPFLCCPPFLPFPCLPDQEEGDRIAPL